MAKSASAPGAMLPFLGARPEAPRGVGGEEARRRRGRARAVHQGVVHQGQAGLQAGCAGRILEDIRVELALQRPGGMIGSDEVDPTRQQVGPERLPLRLLEDGGIDLGEGLDPRKVRLGVQEEVVRAGLRRDVHSLGLEPAHQF